MRSSGSLMASAHTALSVLIGDALLGGVGDSGASWESGQIGLAQKGNRVTVQG